MKTARGSRSAKWLSDRTAELGYRISPTVIAKLDSGHRGSVLSVPEILILSAALDVPVGLLLFPDYPYGDVELLPNYWASAISSVEWLSGSAPLPVQVLEDGSRGEKPPSNDGVALVAAYTRWAAIERESAWISAALHPVNMTQTPPEDRDEYAGRLIDQSEELDRKMKAAEREIEQARTALWGFAEGPSND